MSTVKQTSFHVWIPNMFEFKGGIQVYSTFFLKALQSSYPNATYDIFLKHDIEAKQEYFLPNTRYHLTGRWASPLRTFVFAMKLIIYGLVKRPDLIITTHPNFALAAYVLKQMSKTPYWVVTHGVDAWNIQQPALQRALQGADRILSVSEYTRTRLLQEQNLDFQQIRLLPNTFDESQFQISSKPRYLLNKYQLTDKQPVILTVARLAEAERHKGYDQVIKALPAIRKIIPEIRYIIVGKGQDQGRIEKLIQQYDVQQHVILAGYIPDEELSNYYNLCDVFAMPSKCEGFGIVYLEALACGKPVIGGNQDGAVDALCHGKLGVLVDPDNIEEITQTIIQVIQRHHSNALLYQPQLLRQEVIKTFGFEQFKQTLAQYLVPEFG